MLAFDDSLPGGTFTEALIWGVPAALALRRLRAAPEGRRAAWGVVLASCLVIVLDKLVDLQTAAYRVARVVVGRVDPAMTANGPHQAGRALVLGVAVATGCAVLVLLVRRDRVDVPRGVSLAGLVGVMLFLGVRLVPAVGPSLAGGAGSLIEALCWALVVAGTLLPGARPG